MISALTLVLLLVQGQAQENENNAALTSGSSLMRRQEQEETALPTAWPTENPTDSVTEMPGIPVEDTEAVLRSASRHLAGMNQQDPEDEGSEAALNQQDPEDEGSEEEQSNLEDTDDRGTDLASSDPSAPFYVDFKIHLGEEQPASFVVEVHPDWAPLGAARFKQLATNGFYEGTRFFRVVSGFMAQFGINGKPSFNSQWTNKNIQDDPVKQSNKRGFVTFADAGPNSRSTQVFINFKDNTFLDNQGFSPIGRIVQGMDAVDQLYAGYGEGAPQGSGPDQNEIQSKGNEYLAKDFPLLSYIDKTSIVAKPVASK
jgi:peptidyl-prolyl cis-trans isomerase A (cyclophilin A)